MNPCPDQTWYCIDPSQIMPRRLFLKAVSSKHRHTVVRVFGIPGRGEEVEDVVEDELQVCMALSHQQHHGITASRMDHSRVAATLFPQGLQCWALTHTRETQLSFSF